MDSYIDWNDATSKAQNDNHQSELNPSNNGGITHAGWQNTASASPVPMQNPYNVEPERKPVQQSRLPNDYAQSAYHMSYPTVGHISPSLSPPVTNSSQQQYMYSQHAYPNAASASTVGVAHNANPQNYSGNSMQNYPHPYNYSNSNGAATYDGMYQPQASQSYVNPYNELNARSSIPGTHGNSNHSNAVGQGPSQLQYPYQYAPSTTSHFYPQQVSYQQYQRPEDTLNRVQQAWSGASSNNGLVTSNTSQTQYVWQSQPGSVVYYGMDSRPKAVVKQVAKPPTSSAPSRPSDPLAALRFDVAQCLTEYNTSRDLKGCAAALLTIMSTCDPIVPSSDSEPSKASKLEGTTVKSSAVPKERSNVLDIKTKQTALLTVVMTDIKGAMVGEVSNNKSIRAKLRTWFVRAHKDNAFQVLKAVISVLDKLSSLSALLLAEVKFGKALMIVSRKCEDQEIRDLLVKWGSMAEESLVIERELEAAPSKLPLQEEDRKKQKVKQSVQPNATKGVTRLPIANALSKKAEEKSKSSVAKKPELVAKTNAAFFKKEALAPVKPVVAKPGMTAALAGIKARKKSDGSMGTAVTGSKITILANPEVSKENSVPKLVTTAKPSFSALKLVEGLKRSASPVVVLESEPEVKRQKKKKHVSWRPDSELEEIQLFETVEPEDGWGVVSTPHEYGNARDLDRKEGALLHGGVLPDRDEDFLEWELPKDLDFTRRDLADTSDTRGPKKAGTMKIHSAAAQVEEAREASAALAVYASDSEIPWSPSESAAVSRYASEALKPPKTIPLPQELKDDWRIKQVLGDLTNAPPQTHAPHYDDTILPASAGVNMVAPDSIKPTATPDIAAILASILASQQKSSTSANLNSATDPVPPFSSSNLLPQPDASQIPEQTFPVLHGSQQSAALPPPPQHVDANLAEFLKMAAGNSNGGFQPPHLAMPPLPHTMPPLPPLPTFNPDAMEDTSDAPGHPLPPQFNGLRDVRPWVKYNDNGKFREPCRFKALAKCEKGDNCGYLHLAMPSLH